MTMYTYVTGTSPPNDTPGFLRDRLVVPLLFLTGRCAAAAALLLIRIRHWGGSLLRRGLGFWLVRGDDHLAIVLGLCLCWTEGKDDQIVR